MGKMPLILAFDTSAAHCAAAVVSGDAILADMFEPMSIGQAERLVPMLQDCLKQAGVTWKDLSRLGVGTGPGNFTGIRIAVSTARGISLARQIPAFGVSMFDTLVHMLPTPVVASVDARQGRVYLRRYAGLDEEPLVTEVANPQTSLAMPGLTVCGAFAGELAARLNARVVEPTMPLSVAIALIAASRAPSPHRPAPLYLRPPDAAPARDLPPTIIA